MTASTPHLVKYATEKLTHCVLQEYTLVGKVLGNRYRILREIGSGGMAWVYLAEDIKENQLVAVKVLYPQFGEDLSYIQRFNREAKLASAMTDPHIVRVLDYGADRDIYYLIMEYIEGKDLRETLTEKGPLPWKSALDIIDQLATALEHAHQHGIIHRDIKPQNMMTNDSGLLKVLDFGIARVPTLPSLTQSGFIGSPYYVSPEQAMSEEVDIRSDIYSSGIVLYELLSGNVPFDAKSPWSIISQHIANEPPPINIDDKDFPEVIHDLLNRMVAKRPEDRFQTPSALRRAIAATLVGQTIPDDTFDTRPIPSRDDKVNMSESLYQRALDAIEAKEWARAANLLSQVLEIVPSHKTAAKRLVEAESEAFLLSLYSAGTRAMKANLWEEAINNINGIIEIDPTYKDAEKLLFQARRALEQENAEQFIFTRYNEGVAHFEANRWEDAIEAFREVQRLSPSYERVEQLLAEAEQLNNPTLSQRLTQTINKNIRPDIWWRWALVAIGIIAIIIVFSTLGDRNQVVGDNAAEQELKGLYEAAQSAIESNNTKQAIALLEQILDQNPNYADAAALRRDLIVALTPTSPPPTPTSNPTATPIPLEDPLVIMLNEAQETIELEQWSETIDALQEIRSSDTEFEKARVTFLFCDAYLGRGIETLASIRQPDRNEKEIVSTALADFETGTVECPRRIDLQDQAERASAYLDALNMSKNEHETLIQNLAPIIAAEPNYADGNAKQLLFAAYLKRGDARLENSEIVGALSDYEAALALNVADPSEAQNRRAELLLSLQRIPVAQAPQTPEPPETAESETGEGEVESDKPTPEPVVIRFRKPNLINPEDDSVFAGEFTEVAVEWEPVGELAQDEYYDLTIMHIFADQPAYWGMATQETRIQLSPDIGFGQAGGDRFYWWVTVRKANSAPSANSLDLAVSPRSEAKTFIWAP